MSARQAQAAVVERLGSAFARYDRAEMAGALLATIELFRDLATERRMPSASTTRAARPAGDGLGRRTAPSRTDILA